MLMIGEMKHCIVVSVIVAIASMVTFALTVVAVLGYQAYSREQWSEIKSEWCHLIYCCYSRCIILPGVMYCGR